MKKRGLTNLQQIKENKSVMKLTALIPARGGSKGVPRKNIKLLGGHPLIAYTIGVCKLSSFIDDIIVSTEDKEIANIAKQYGAKVPYLRPHNLAQDISTDQDVINDFFNNSGNHEVAYLRPTTPLRNHSLLDNYITSYFTNKKKISGFRSMHEAPEPPYKMFQIKDDGFCCGFFKDFNGIKDYTNLPRQSFPKAYHPNGYIDVVKRSTSLNYPNAFGSNVYPCITDFVTEIDTIDNFKFLEYEIQSGKLSNLVSYLGHSL